MRKAKRHTVNPNGMGGPCCRKCGLPWPCDAAVLTQELAAIRKRLDRIASVNEFLAARKEREPAVLLRDTPEGEAALHAAVAEAMYEAQGKGYVTRDAWMGDDGNLRHVAAVWRGVLAALRGEA